MNKHLLKLIIFFALTAATIEPTNAKGKEKRLEKIFTKGKYERCLKKCNRMLHRKLTSLPYYYISFVHFQHFKSPPTDKTHLTENYLQSAILNLSFALEIDYNEKNKQNYNLRLTEIKDTLIAKNHSLIAEEKWDASLIYAQKVWEFFSDSTGLIARNEALEDTTPPKIKPVDVPATPSLEELTRSLLVARADGLAGIKYTYGGQSPETGFDCSGYVQYLYNGLGYKLPRNSYWQSTKGNEIDESEAQPGDLVFFSSKSKGKDGINHVGLVRSLKNGVIVEIIHSSNDGVALTVRGTHNFEYWYNRIVAIKNVLSDFLNLN